MIPALMGLKAPVVKEYAIKSEREVYEPMIKIKTIRKERPKMVSSRCPSRVEIVPYILALAHL